MDAALPDAGFERDATIIEDGGAIVDASDGAPDAGAPDAGAPDAGAPDAGAPDAGPPPMITESCAMDPTGSEPRFPGVGAHQVLRHGSGFVLAGDASAIGSTTQGATWLRYVDELGTTIWERRFAVAPPDLGASILSTAVAHRDGTMTFAGVRSWDPRGAWISWTSADGILEREITTGDGPSGLSSVNDAVALDDGSVMTVGETAGRYLWARRLTRDGASLLDVRMGYGGTGYGVAAFADGGLAVAGRIATSVEMDEGWVLRLDAAGAVVWEARFDRRAIGRGTPHRVAVLPSGDVLIAGKGGRSTWVARFDGASGVVLWSKRFARVGDYGSAYILAMELTPDGRAVIASGVSHAIGDSWRSTVDVRLIDPSDGTELSLTEVDVPGADRRGTDLVLFDEGHRFAIVGIEFSVDSPYTFRGSWLRTGSCVTVPRLD